MWFLTSEPTKGLWSSRPKLNTTTEIDYINITNRGSVRAIAHDQEVEREFSVFQPFDICLLIKSLRVLIFKFAKFNNNYCSSVFLMVVIFLDIIASLKLVSVLSEPISI